MIFTHTGLLHRVLFPWLLWRMPGKKIYLTFDDGPHPIATEQVLDVLQKHHVHATFFISGKNILGREHIVRRIENEGHSIGIHAFTHTRKLAFSKTRTNEEIVRTDTLLNAIVSQQTRLFRPPFGFFSWNTIAAARERKFLLVMWSCLSGDYRNIPNSRVVRHALEKLSGGSILVFHDNDLTQFKISDILEEVIIGIRERGYEFGSIR